MSDSQRKLAVVTGASTGIGLELARECAKNDFDLIIAANEAEIESAAEELRRDGGTVEVVQADLATTEGVDKLYGKINGRPVAALLANAGRGLGKGFLDQDFDEARYVVDTNVTGTIYLIHKVGRGMRAQGEGRILITGSIAGFMPGSYQAVYNGTKAFLELVLLRATGRAQGHRRDGDLPHAGRDRNRVFPQGRHARYESRDRQEGRSRRCCKGRFQGNDVRRRRSGKRLAEQARGRGRPCDPV